MVVQSPSFYREDLEERKQRGDSPNILFKSRTQRPHSKPQLLNVPLPPVNAENQTSGMKSFRTY